MPTYEYRCPAGHKFEKFQKITSDPVAQCPECGAPGERMISGGAGLLFKGSGFYITDYGKDGKGPARPPKASETAAKKDSTPSTKDSSSKSPSTGSDSSGGSKPSKPSSQSPGE